MRGLESFCDFKRFILRKDGSVENEWFCWINFVVSLFKEYDNNLFDNNFSCRGFSGKYLMFFFSSRYRFKKRKPYSLKWNFSIQTRAKLAQTFRIVCTRFCSNLSSNLRNYIQCCYWTFLEKSSFRSNVYLSASTDRKFLSAYFSQLQLTFPNDTMYRVILSEF